LLVFGSTGYVGRTLCKRLSEIGLPFSTLNRVRGGDPFLFLLKDGQEESQGDIRDEGFLRELNYGSVVILAAETSRKRDPKTTADLVHANALLPAVLGANFSDKGTNIIFASTYSYRKFGFDYFTQSAYAASKCAGERMLEYFSTRSFLSSVVRHIHDVYGPNQPHNRLIPYVYSKVQSGQELHLSPGDQEISPLFVGDLVEVIIRLAQDLSRKIGSFSQFDVFGPDVIQVKDLPNTLVKALGLELEPKKIRLGKHDYREREIMVFDNCHPLPVIDLNWTPFSQGLRLSFGK